IDSRDEQGLYHKARLIMIGGKLYPRHYMVGDSWMVGDTHKTYMAGREETKLREKNFLGDWSSMIAPAALNSLEIIGRKLGLDYVGFDFAIRPDGTLLVFEINAAQNVFLKLDEKNFPYMVPARQSIIEKFNDRIASLIAGEK